MIQQLEMGSIADETSYPKVLLNALKNKELKKFQDTLKKNSDIDIDYYFGDPDHGTLLYLSCMNDDCHMFVNSLLSYGADPNKLNTFRKKAPLHCATEKNYFLTVENLVNFEKTDVNITDSMGNTPLHLAVKLKYGIQILELLLRHKNVDVNKVNHKLKSALFIALEEQNESCVDLLLCDNNLNLNHDPNFLKIKELLDVHHPEWKKVYKSKKNNSQPNVNVQNNVWNLLLSGKYNEFISVLHDMGGDPKFLESNNNSRTFLQYCCELGLIDVIKELLCLKNLNVNATSITLCRTPLMIAAFKGNIDIIKMLIATNMCSFEPVNRETVLHCVVKGSSEKPGLGYNKELTIDHLMCLSYLLEVSGCKVFINYGDIKGNTALHIVAKQGDIDMMFQLLKSGASINCFNMLDEPAFAYINYKTLKDYLDSCIYTNDKLPREEDYEIILNYTGLKPVCCHYSHIDDESGNSPYQDYDSCKECNNFETKSLLYMSQNRELKYLLKHPIFTSFLHLKWLKIHKFFFINLIFYILFLITLTFYILCFYPEFNRSDANSGSFKPINVVGWILTMFVFLLILRETAQLCIAPLKYLWSFENWLEIALICITLALLFLGKDTPFQYKVNLSAIAIMLSWSELVFLIGRHPALSTKLEMLKTVSWNFLAFLAWYSVLIAAFAISFYILFGFHGCSDPQNTVCSDNLTATDDDFFGTIGVSFFKTVIMLTGEFDASSIPFNERPGISHVLFVAFVFLIAIVLFNLLNGLAVSDIQAIKSDAELVGYISRVKLIAYVETLVLDPLPAINKNHCLNKYACYKSSFISYYMHKVFSGFINIFKKDYLTDPYEIRILPNLGNNVEINQFRSSVNRKESDFSLTCYKTPQLIGMDSSIVHRVKEIILDRIVEKEIKETDRKRMENEQLLIKLVNDCQENLLSLRSDVREIKRTLNL